MERRAGLGPEAERSAARSSSNEVVGSSRCDRDSRVQTLTVRRAHENETRDAPRQRPRKLQVDGDLDELAEPMSMLTKLDSSSRFDDVTP